MNKKILMVTTALLALSMLTISPIKAKTVELYESHLEAELIDPGKQWVSEEGILHIKGAYWLGTEVGTLGTGIFEEWYQSFSLNLATGEGTLTVKWLLTFPEGTIAGSARAKITGGFQISGSFVGTHGTGEFEGVRKMGSIEGVILDPEHIEGEILGIVVYP